jgi:hypothetical protein
MAHATAPLPLPTIPPEVMAYAEQEGAASYLVPMAEMTRALFPDAPMEMVLRPDPEVADLTFLSFDVGPPDDASVDWYVAAQKRWLEETMRLCPPPVAIVFTLSLLGPGYGRT